jgi:hypothetical protein
VRAYHQVPLSASYGVLEVWTHIGLWVRDYNRSMIRRRGTTPALSILCGHRWPCPQDSIRPWRRHGKVVSGPPSTADHRHSLSSSAEPMCCLLQWSRDMVTITSSTCFHERNRRSSWLVLLGTESMKGLANVIHWQPDYSAQSIVCDRHLTDTRQALIFLQ